MQIARRVPAAAVLLLLVWLPAACNREESVAADQQLAAQLKSVRDGLSTYAKKHGRYPVSLEEMVTSGELPEIPTDPITGSSSTWKLVREESVAVNEFSTEGSVAEGDAPIVDVRSGASGSDTRGTPWSEY